MCPKDYGKIALNDIGAKCSVRKFVAGISRLAIGSKHALVIPAASCLGVVPQERRRKAANFQFVNWGLLKTRN